MLTGVATTSLASKAGGMHGYYSKRKRENSDDEEPLLSLLVSKNITGSICLLAVMLTDRLGRHPKLKPELQQTPSPSIQVIKQLAAAGFVATTHDGMQQASSSTQ
jgi:hypothetical protein